MHLHEPAYVSFREYAFQRRKEMGDFEAYPICLTIYIWLAFEVLEGVFQPLECEEWNTFQSFILKMDTCSIFA